MSRNSENRHLRDEPKKYATVQSDEGNLVRLHAEPFWRNRPDLWFQKIEALLSNCNIDVDTRKYNFVISLLDEETALEVKDIIIEPPDFDKYDVLKEQLIKRITAKNEEKAKKRMMAEPMGDRTPSEFYCHLSTIAGCYVRDRFVEEVWLECLPSKIRSVVECLKDYELDTLTTVADRVHKVFFSPPTEKPAVNPASSALMESLIKEVENLNKKVQMLKPRGPPSRAQLLLSGRDLLFNPPQPNPSQCNAPTKPKKNASNQIAQSKPCFIHRKYGVKLCKIRKNSN